MVRFWKVTSITANKLGSNPLSSKYFNFALIFEMVRNNVCKKYLNTISHPLVFYFFSFLILIVPGSTYPQKSLKNWKVKNITHIFFRFFFVNSSSTFLYTQGHLHKKKSYTPTFFHFVKISITTIEKYWRMLHNLGV